LPLGTIFKVIKPLYGIPEAGNHWWTTYYKHHIGNLDMETSTFDPCLLVTRDNDSPFGIVGIQTDDTLILRDVDFMAREQSELEKAKLLAKPIEALSLETPLLFNGCKLVKDSDGDGITMI